MSRLLSHNLFVRTLAGAVLALIVVGLTFFSPFTMLALLAAICIGAMLEFYKLARLTGAQPLDTYPTFLGTLLVVMGFFARLHKIPFSSFLIFLPAVFLIFAVELFRKKENPFANRDCVIVE